jgi:hypothetical protein
MNKVPLGQTLYTLSILKQIEYFPKSRIAHSEQIALLQLKLWYLPFAIAKIQPRKTPSTFAADFSTSVSGTIFSSLDLPVMDRASRTERIRISDSGKNFLWGQLPA